MFFSFLFLISDTCNIPFFDCASISTSNNISLSKLHSYFSNSFNQSDEILSAGISRENISYYAKKLADQVKKVGDK